MEALPERSERKYSLLDALTQSRINEWFNCPVRNLPPSLGLDLTDVGQGNKRFHAHHCASCKEEFLERLLVSLFSQ